MNKTTPQEDIFERYEIEIFGYTRAKELSNLRRIRAFQYVRNGDGEEYQIELSPIFAARRIIVNELHNDISEKKLTELLFSIGYNVLFGHSNDNNKVIESIGQTEFSKKVRAFAYADTNGNRIVFINTQKNKNGYLHSLVHELGHIVMGHLNSWGNEKLSESEKEAEAETFAKVMLHHSNKIQKTEVSANA